MQRNVFDKNNLSFKRSWHWSKFLNYVFSFQHCNLHPLQRSHFLQSGCTKTLAMPAQNTTTAFYHPYTKMHTLLCKANLNHICFGREHGVFNSRNGMQNFRKKLYSLLMKNILQHMANWCFPPLRVHCLLIYNNVNKV